MIWRDLSDSLNEMFFARRETTDPAPTYFVEKGRYNVYWFASLAGWDTWPLTRFDTPFETRELAQAWCEMHDRQRG